MTGFCTSVGKLSTVFCSLKKATIETVMFCSKIQALQWYTKSL